MRADPRPSAASRASVWDAPNRGCARSSMISRWPLGGVLVCRNSSQGGVKFGQDIQVRRVPSVFFSRCQRVQTLYVNKLLRFATQRSAGSCMDVDASHCGQDRTGSITTRKGPRSVFGLVHPRALAVRKLKTDPGSYLIRHRA